MSESIKQFIATKAFIVKDGKVLILKESSKYEDGTNVSRFDLPGGRLTPGEHFVDALQREVKEETGLTVQIGNTISVGEWRPVVRNEQWQIIGIFFECSTDDSTITLSPDHDDFQWINPHDYEHYSLIDNLKPIFKKYLLSK